MTDGGRGRLGSGLETCGPASPWDWDTLVTIYYLPLCLKLSRKHTLRRYFLSPYYDTHLVWSLLLIVFTAHISPVCYAGRPPRLCCKVLTALLWPGEEERCSMKTPHIHRLASLASTAPDTAAGHMTYLTHARVPSGFSRHWWLPSQFPCTECTQHCTAALQAGERCAGAWCADCGLHYVQLCWDNFRHKSCNYINTTPTRHQPPLCSHYSDFVREHAQRSIKNKISKTLHSQSTLNWILIILDIN